MTTRERLISFLAYLKMGQDRFEKSVGLSRGFVNNVGDSIRTSSLNKITMVYPELNTSWLLTGVGSMLNQPQEDHGVNQVGSTYIGSTFVGYGNATNNKTHISGSNSIPNKEPDLQLKLESLIIEVDSLKAEINMLKGENRVLREQLGLGERKESSKTA